MHYRAYQKHIRTSPRKLRLVVDSIRGQSPSEALATLKFLKKRAAGPILKVLKQAIGNAKDQRVKEEDLKFVKLEVEEGPTLKRWQPIARGRAHRILKRTSHIKIILSSKSSKSSKGK